MEPLKTKTRFHFITDGNLVFLILVLIVGSSVYHHMLITFDLKELVVNVMSWSEQLKKIDGLWIQIENLVLAIVMTH